MALEEGFRANTGKLREHADLCSEELRAAWALQDQLSFLRSYAESMGDGSLRPLAAQADRLAAFFRAKRDWVERTSDELEHFSRQTEALLEDAQAEAVRKFRALNTVFY